MNAATNFLYRQITHIGRGLTLAQGLQMRLSGEENIPDDGGAVLVCNHTGYMDFLFGAFIAYRKKRLVRFLAKASIFSAPGVGALLRAMGHVPVDRIDGKESLRKAVELAEAGELVGVFSEGTISRSFEIRSMKTGASRIAFEAGGAGRPRPRGVPRPGTRGGDGRRRHGDCSRGHMGTHRCRIPDCLNHSPGTHR